MASGASKNQECLPGTTHLCSHCEEDGEHTSAKIFCFSCQIHLCAACERHHGKFFRKHKIGRSDDMSEGDSDRFIPCDKHPKDRVEFYCKEDNDVFCKYCKISKHKSCKITTIVECSFDVARVQEYNSMCEALKKMNLDLESTERKRKSDIDRALNDAADHKKMLKKLREEMDAYFDRYESYLDEHSVKVKDAMKQYNDNSNFIEYLKIATDALERAIQNEKREEIFINFVKAKQICKEYHASIAPLPANNEHLLRLGYQDESLHSIIRKLTEIADEENFDSDEVAKHETDPDGETVAENGKEKKGSDLSFWDMGRPSLIVVAAVPKLDCIEKPYISGCCAIADNHIILCDSANHRLIIYDQTLRYECDLPCTGEPFDIAAVDYKSAVVTIPKRKEIQYVSIRPIEFGRKFRLNFMCYGVAFREFPNELFVSASDSVKVLTLSGNELRTILNPYIVGPIRYITINEDATRVYFTVQGSPVIGCVSGLEKPSWPCSKLMFQYSNVQKSPQSISVDVKGNSMACDYKLGCLRVINPEGTNGTTILTGELLKPSSFLYASKSGSLFITTDDETGGTIIKWYKLVAF